MRYLAAAAAVVAAVLLFPASPAAAEDVQYTYDAAGRLTAAIYPSRDLAILYTYDAAGNLLRRDRSSADCNGQPLPCDDGDPCTVDRCDPLTGCVADFVPGPACSTTTTTLAPQVCGDFSGDGTITATDALGVLKTAVGLASCAPAVCDVDGSGTITATDALAVLRAAVGIGGPLACS